jgi:hypothetical protein
MVRVLNPVTKLKEDLVKAIMAEYFRQKQIDAHVTGKGEAGADYGRLLEQLTLYSFRQREIQLAIPIDALTANGLLRLYFLEGVLREMRNKGLKLYLVSDGEATFYYIKEFDSVMQFFQTEMNHFAALVEAIQGALNFSEQLGTLTESKVREVAHAVGDNLYDTDFAVGRILGEAMKKFPYVMVAKTSVKM